MGELYEFVENPEPSLVTCISIFFTGDKFDGNIRLKMEGIRFYHNDHLGTLQVLTDENGQIAWYGDYEPFGKVNILVERTTNNFRFPGQYYIEETGLYYNWWRWYGNEVGRYVQKDNIIQVYAANSFYLYSNNSPSNFYDINGKYCENYYLYYCPPPPAGYEFLKAIPISLGYSVCSIHKECIVDTNRGERYCYDICYPLNGSCDYVECIYRTIICKKSWYLTLYGTCFNIIKCERQWT